ncbi:MAG TPA: alpha/beta hydrolase [Candidatus Dormibacteraeota bacterium]|nr:alpha/beta hydrolase [Candidatus Dormibacteraeota bacterium]
MLLRALALGAAFAAGLTAPAAAFPVNFGPGFTTRTVTVDGCTISATIGGHGPALLLLHGYAEDSRMWKPLAVALAPSFTVIAPDLPGIGNSSIPSSGIDMTTSARRVHDAVAAFGYRDVRVAGHDIGLMVAYAYAATYPSEVKRLALMDAFLPGVDGWEPIYNSPNYWHFRFYGPTPLALVRGRERTYFDYFWNDFAANPNRSIPEINRVQYAAAYSRPGRMAAGFAYFASFQQTAAAFAKLAQTKLTMPVLSIGGDKSLGVPLGAQTRLVASDVTVVVVKNAGHWIMEEQPAQTMAALTQFLERP